jgi:hypothetical protein
VSSPTFAEVQSSALNAKNRAKNVRKDWKAKEPGRSRDAAFTTAVNDLDAAVAALRDWGAVESPYRKDAEREIGDCLGVKGGTCRDWGKYADAARSYDAGLPYEQRAKDLGGQPNSYCLVQRLVCRILLEPEEFQRHGRSRTSGLELDLDAALAESAETVRAQIALRTDKRWAQADRALVLQLLGGRSTRGFRDATAEWDTLDDLGQDRYVYDSTLETVNTLKMRLEPYLDLNSRRAWDDVVDRLTLS